MTTITSGFRGVNNEILPTDTTTWNDLGSSPFATWENWTTWHPSPNNVVITQTVDTGSIALQQPLLEVYFAGTASITLDISDTGSFGGEETTIDLSDGTAKTYVRGRHYRWTVTVAPDSNTLIPAATDLQPAFNLEPRIELQNDVDIPALATDSSGYRLVPTNLGLITNVQATAIQGDSYVVDGYILSALTQADYVRTARTITDSGTTFNSEAQFGTHSLEFSGTNYFTVPQASSGEMWNNAGDFTVEFWIYVPTGSTNNVASVIEIPKTSFAGNPFKIFLTGTTLYFNTFNPTDGTYANNVSLSNDTWHHIAVTYEGSTTSLNFFLDGAQEFAPTFTGSFEEVSNNIIFGDVGVGTGFEGYLDEIRWSNTTRYLGSSFSVPTDRFYNDPNTQLLIHGDNTLEDDGGFNFGPDEYFVTQRGGVAQIESKNPLAIRVTDYNGDPWDGTVDLVLRGTGKIQQSTDGVVST